MSPPFKNPHWQYTPAGQMSSDYLREKLKLVRERQEKEELERAEYNLWLNRMSQQQGI